MKRITILGSTGSIGQSTLQIIDQCPQQFEVVALSAKTNIERLSEQCQKYKPTYAVVDKESDANLLKKRLQEVKCTTNVLSGAKALEEIAALPEADYVMAAIVGAAGLLPTFAAAKAGKRILLANKESLVMSGALFMDTVKQNGAQLFPVDSEHNAIFQCLPPDYVCGNPIQGIEKIQITASGGPFLRLPLEQFDQVTPEKALRHPVWNMGPKITIDCATMVNKGLEVIEAHWLFNIDASLIEVIIHPQSIIHSLIAYQDGSFLAQLGMPDMKIPIAYTLSHPLRLTTQVKRLNLRELNQLTFEAVDWQRFPCLKLCYEALAQGGTANTVLNAANEVAVAAFLKGHLAFSEIPTLIAQALEESEFKPANSIEVILEVDRLTRSKVERWVESRALC